jgi:hypothetical protein
MSKKEHEEESSEIERTLEYVYIPYENVYGTIVRYGAWSSLIEYFDGGIQYTIEVANEDFIEVDQIGIGYLEETEDNL